VANCALTIEISIFTEDLLVSKGLFQCICLFGVLAAMVGCRGAAAPADQPAKIDYTAPLPEGELALRKIGPDQYPDFAAALSGINLDDLRRAVDHSLEYFQRAGSQRGYSYLDISHDRAVASLHAFRALLDRFPQPGEFNAAIAQTFDVYQSIGASNPDGSGYTSRVLFTGYFTPTYDASMTRGGPYQWPLYKRPADLVSDVTGERDGRRATDGSFAPYLTRQQIETGALAGSELVWLTSRWNAYVITVQGSGRLRLPDGKIYEVGYSGTNGYDYTSPGAQMVADGLIPRDQLNFNALKQYFDAHPEAMDKYLWLNQRTVFFTERPGGPFGSLNVPVTPFASIATDKHVYPAGMVAFVSVPIPAGTQTPGTGNALSTREFNGFLLDQDRGGAIRSAGRCDIYMGIGDRAEETSGYQLNPGSLYYLAVKWPRPE
jgi:membrane-bound lytic murein transglycosylase A